MSVSAKLFTLPIICLGKIFQESNTGTQGNLVPFFFRKIIVLANLTLNVGMV